MEPRSRRMQSLQPVVSIPPHLSEDFDECVKLMREMLTEFGIPRESWHRIWDDMDDFPELDANPIVQYWAGWFRGVAETLGVTEAELVVL